LAATVLIWTTPSLFQYYLFEHYDVWTQNFYRYAAGFLVVLPFGYLKRGGESGKISWSQWRAAMLTSLPNALHQITQTLAVLFMLPGLYAVFGRMAVLITAVLAGIMLVEERWVWRSRLFKIALLVGVGAGMGLAFFRPGVTWATDWKGVALALVAISTWALYSVLIKKQTVQMGPARAFSLIGFLTSVVLLICMLAFGDGGAILRAPWQANLILFGSGALCIGLGHALFYASVRDLGATFTQSIQLLSPLGTVLLSGWLFGEVFQPVQWALALVLLGGTLLAMLAREREISLPK